MSGLSLQATERPRHSISAHLPKPRQPLQRSPEILSPWPPSRCQPHLSPPAAPTSLSSVPPRAKCLLSNPSLSELFFLISIHSSILEGFIGQAPSPFLPSFPGGIHSSSHEGVNGQAPSPFFQSLLGSSGCALALLSAPSLAAAYIQTFRHSRIFWPSPSPALFSQSVFTPLKSRPRPPPAFRPRLNQRNLPVPNLWPPDTCSV